MAVTEYMGFKIERISDNSIGVTYGDLLVGLVSTMQMAIRLVDYIVDNGGVVAHASNGR